MRTSVIAAAAALAAVSVAPPASADEPAFGCTTAYARHPDVTGHNNEGVAYGYVTHPGATTIRCEIRVNGTVVAVTESGSGSTFGRVTFTAGAGDDVMLHAIATTEHGEHIRDYPTAPLGTPPDVPYDELFGVVGWLVTEYVDPPACDVLADLAGNYWVVSIASDGDISLDGGSVWDCPPYGG